MGQRLLQILLAELLAFGSFVLGGIALLGALATAAGDSQHTALVSWGLVCLFAIPAIVLGRAAALRLRVALRREPVCS